ncbi:MAG: hypothetical protein JSU70_04380 [Phycisphaerales bacterium]|nr:MAG: hypothetical protein JSU70_04380 [Phycisphaerales bacterium]
MAVGAFILLGLAKIAGGVTIVKVIRRKKDIKHMAGGKTGKRSRQSGDDLETVRE